MKRSFEDLEALYEQNGAVIDRLCEYFDDLGQLHGLSVCGSIDGRETLELIFIHGIVEIPNPTTYFRDAGTVLGWEVSRDDMSVRPVYTLPNGPPTN